jgi:hypothetical protein
MPQILRRDDAEFGHVSAQSIDQHRAVPDQKNSAVLTIKQRATSTQIFGSIPSYQHRARGLGQTWRRINSI